MNLKIGCTGWGYKEWEGTFYPRTVKQRDWLRHYSSIFDITEVNSSFYQTISKPMAQKWYNETPDIFRFSLKFPQKITHEYKLDYEKSKDVLTAFFSGLEPLRQKISVLVLQLPPSLTFDMAKPLLELLGNHLPHYCRYAIEGRHESWFSNYSLDFLSQNNYCFVWNEVPMVENPAPITTDFVYVRLIGDRSLPKDVYDHKVLDQTNLIAKWANKISELKQNKQIISVWAVLNNHLEGYAPTSANTLRILIGLDELEFGGKTQKSILNFDEDIDHPQ